MKVNEKEYVKTADRDAPVRYPEVEVQLTGNDGNAFAIMGAVGKALRDAGVEESEIEKYQNESMSGDYDHLLQTAMAWVNVK